MIIRALLLSVLASILFYAISQRRRSRLLSSIMIVITLVGGAFVAFPGWTQLIAGAVGVGRGADLITYCFIVVTLVAIFNLHLRLRASAELLTDLARAMALASAQHPRAPDRVEDGMPADARTPPAPGPFSTSAGAG